MLYQWGHKDSFTFATSSEKWGGSNSEIGKYPVKIYTIDGVLIYQESNGSSNKDKQPVGGTIIASTVATSMMDVIKNPMTFYGNNSAVINQVGHTKSLWDYYWTSYSRGTDGSTNVKLWHNDYLDDYKQQRSKSIFDPCPFGFRIPSNGSWNQIPVIRGWVAWDYLTGITWRINNVETWISALDFRLFGFRDTGYYGLLFSSTISFINNTYILYLVCNSGFSSNQNKFTLPYVISVRCIEVSPPQLTDEIRLAVQEVSILVSKTVTLMDSVINGDAKIHLHLLQIASNGGIVIKKENILLRYIL